jgi:hypothetical protein
MLCLFYENIKKIVFSSIGLKGRFRVRKLIKFLDKKKAKRHGRDHVTSMRENFERHYSWKNAKTIIVITGYAFAIN